MFHVNIEPSSQPCIYSCILPSIEMSLLPLFQLPNVSSTLLFLPFFHGYLTESRLYHQFSFLKTTENTRFIMFTSRRM
ncbi:hypothetical protein Hanom_Chr15g01377471 [Helianthus anomalus]